MDLPGGDADRQPPLRSSQMKFAFGALTRHREIRIAKSSLLFALPSQQQAGR
jgi:hypothetical protein